MAFAVCNKSFEGGGGASSAPMGPVSLSLKLLYALLEGKTKKCQIKSTKINSTVNSG